MTDEKLDIVKVILANAGAGLVAWADKTDLIKVMAEVFQTSLSIAATIIAISYTVWKWRNDIRKKKANIKKYYEEKEGE